MNIRIKSTVNRGVVSIFTLLAIPHAFAGESYFDGYAVESNLTVSMTGTSSGPALRAKDEDGVLIPKAPLVFQNNWSTSKGDVSSSFAEQGYAFQVRRLSNREILTEVILEEERDTTISGWALKLITPAEYAGMKMRPRGYILVGPSSTRIIAVKKGKPTVEVSFLQLYGGSQAESGNALLSRTYNSDTEAESYKQNGLMNSIRSIDTEMSIRSLNFEFCAIQEIRQFLNPFAKNSDQGYWLPTSIAFKNITGTFQQMNQTLNTKDYEDESSSVLQGSMSASGGKLIDLDID